MDIGHAGFDQLAELKLAAVLGDFDRADLARPFVGVLKQVAMDGLGVIEVESPAGAPSRAR